MMSSRDGLKLWFRSYKSLEKDGITVEHKNYKMVYSGELNIAGTTIERLNRLFEIFNIERPKDFIAHSMSVGDVVALRQDGKISYHYVDSFGFKELTDFMNP